MDKTTLYKIFNKAFDDASWLEVLKSVFGAKLGLWAQYKPILLPNNDKADAAFELGSFTTTDDRIIGLYKIELKPEVWLERNKVGLRELLRNVYKYDVDGAIIVFVQQDKWRLSFVSEIKVLNDEGEIVEQATEPKRYTYLLGEGEKVRTPSDRLSRLTGKSLALQDILNAFSVEALNEEFYKIIQEYFYKLIGGKIGKGKKVTDYGEGILQLPSVPKENRQVYQEFAVRLIGRTVFCWFLKMKKSDAAVSLLPESLLSSKAVKQYSGYYHSILERLFFQTLNTSMDQRVDNLPEGAEQIPFLNGGLFEPGIPDYYKPNNVTGLNENLNTLKIDDQWFVKLFEELEKYNFTIDENSVTDVEVSVDPEMLGRIFENLLAEIDPDSGETARKATGSFYTPREIVDYMATESLVQYLKNKLNDELGMMNDELKSQAIRTLFKVDQPIHSSLITHHSSLLDALDQVKILDPACGSGAFPMGVLQKIVQALQKLDPEATWWKKRQIDRVRKASNNALVTKMFAEKLNSGNAEYARKIGVIQNSLYGVDIQPVAAEISKLRCFLSLVVDENIDENKPNRGIEPLPNLEFKFVTADTLISLPQNNSKPELNKKGKKSTEELEKDLDEVRQEYIQSFGENKKLLKQKFKDIQKLIFDQQGLFGSLENSRAYKISTWNPFSHEKSTWFDPKWMFGVEKFDVVIGNPPYIKEYTNKAAFDSIRGKKYYQGKMDIWYYFACHLFDYLSDEGNLTFIATNNWVTNSGASKLRDKITRDCQIIQLIDFGNTKVFSSADIQTMILIAEKESELETYEFDYRVIDNDSATLKDTFSLLTGIPSVKYSLSKPEFHRSIFKSNLFIFNTTEREQLLIKIKTKQNFYLDSRTEVAQGIVPNPDVVNSRNIQKLDSSDVSVGDGVFIVEKGSFDYLGIPEKKYIKPVYEPYLVDRYKLGENDKEIIYITKNNYKNDAPKLIEHLSKFRPIMEERRETKNGRLDYFHLHWPREQSFFEKGAKVLSVRKCSRPTFIYTEEESYVMMSFNVIKTERINQKYLTGLLNSKLIEFWLRYKGKMQGFNFQVDKEPLLEIPIFKSENSGATEILVDYIIAVLQTDAEINPHVPNSHIAQLFEEVIDAIVMELYFKEDFERAGIEFIKYVESDFESIDGKSEKEQIEVIHRAYQKLREKDNEIRNNLKLMDIKLADIVMPIKTAR